MRSRGGVLVGLFLFLPFGLDRRAFGGDGDFFFDRSEIEDDRAEREDFGGSEADAVALKRLET